LYVCLSASAITPEPLRDIITKVSGHDPVIERADKFENGYIEVHGWWFNVPGVVVELGDLLKMLPSTMAIRLKFSATAFDLCF